MPGGTSQPKSTTLEPQASTPSEERVPTPYYTTEGVTLHLGDCLDILPTLPDNSVDAVVCDPPYGLTELAATTVLQAISAWMAGDRTHVPDGKGFMGKDWDRFVPPPGVWDECLRVLKPGGHLAAFSAPRTLDLMTLSIRIAGFEIRDSLHWITGSGFPKSLDVSKAIDKAGGASPEEQAAVLRRARERAGLTREGLADAVGCKVTSIRNWEDGRARAAGRDVEYIIPSAEYRARLADLLGYSADERSIAGVREDRRGDNTVIGLGHSGIKYGSATTELAHQWSGWGTALKPAHEPIVLARKPLAGTVAGNVLAHGTGALNIGGCRVGVEARSNHAGGSSSLQRVSRVEHGYRKAVTASVGQSSEVVGRWPSNVLLAHPPLLDEHGQPVGDACADGCVPGCPVAEMDAQSGITGSNARANKGERYGSLYNKPSGEAGARGHYDSGGASRFFHVFRYEAKAGSAERPRLPDGTAHPTVKPVSLMSWLVRLVTPPGGTVLEPFAGSGTTLEACVLEGVEVIGIERHEPYAELCRVRLSKPIETTLFGTVA